jgi:crotonobetainyl-CoA:carnitine CoA-transferase CaiB-like acyl-CoA transferase
MNGVKTRVPVLPIEMAGRRLQQRSDLPKIGEHTLELLVSLGYSSPEIEDLLQQGVARAA